MSVLSSSERRHLSSKSFAIPSKAPGSGSYPIPDASHARNALARVAQHGSSAEQAAVRAKVHAKFPGIGHAAGGTIVTPGISEDFSQDGLPPHRGPSAAEHIHALMREHTHNALANGAVITTPGIDETFSQDGKPGIVALANGAVGVPPVTGMPAQPPAWQGGQGGQPAGGWPQAGQGGQQGGFGGGRGMWRQGQGGWGGGQGGWKGQGQGGWGGQGQGGGQAAPQQPPAASPGIIHAQGLAPGGWKAQGGGQTAPAAAPGIAHVVGMAKGGLINSEETPDSEYETEHGGKKPTPFQFRRYR